MAALAEALVENFSDSLRRTMRSCCHLLLSSVLLCCGPCARSQAICARPFLS